MITKGTFVIHLPSTEIMARRQRCGAMGAGDFALIDLEYQEWCQKHRLNSHMNKNLGHNC